MIRTLLILVLAAALAACGFQLRGEAQLPSEMQRTYIASTGRADLPRQLSLLFGANDVEVVQEREQATAVLVLVEDRITRVVQSVGATARVREFALVYTVRFRLEDAQGQILMDEQQMELTNDYQFDQRQVQGTTSEEEILRQEMVRTMGRQILRRLEFVART